MDKSSNTVEIDRQALSELVGRVEEAIEHDLSLSIDDLKLLLLACLFDTNKFIGNE